MTYDLKTPPSNLAKRRAIALDWIKTLRLDDGNVVPQDETPATFFLAITEAGDLVATSVAPVTLLAATTFTPDETHNGSFVGLTAAGDIAVTLPATLTAGYSVCISQEGAGQITFAGEAGATLTSVDGIVTTRTQYSAATALVISNTIGTNAVWRLTGDME
jgi:hypothetical protein